MSNEFRPLNEMERSAIMTWAKKGRIPLSVPLVENIGSLAVSYEFQQGGFCVCILHAYGSRFVYRGASRRSYRDPRKRTTGEMLAFQRAVLYSRPAELLV